MKYNEDSRVKIPTILHLMRLGYNYLSLSDQNWDTSNNIFTDIFQESIKRINPDYGDEEIDKLYDEVTLSLENEDLGKAFYEMLVDRSGKKLIDFNDFDNNSFHVVTELPYKNDDEVFRPDITLLINGMPLVFIEVKKPNNREGIIAEQKRIKTRFRNKKFRNFVNITQLMVFSNNMEYDDDSPATIQGAFYAPTSYEDPTFNYFREEEDFDLQKILNTISDQDENDVLRDNNLVSIKDSQEFSTNKRPDTPTNRICTSLFKRERLKFILNYGIVYVKERSGIEEHVMRYPQMFATKAIADHLEKGERKGIIWHTQGSGKTALAYYNVKYLKDYFREQDVIPKFYFIVDRLDLLVQAKLEFKSRGLFVNTVNSKDEFAKEIKSSKAIHNDSGMPEITVVNIQKFKDDPDVTRNTDYDIDIQRIYFLDEVHRSYNPEGSFLANLKESDPNAIKIGLTGTPLLGDDYTSRDLFGDYIHKYYYNASIADGYTLRLIREEIETSYRLQLQKALEEIEILKGDADKRFVYSHHKFVEPMLDYIIDDFENTRIAKNDHTIGGMVICDSSDQAKKMFKIFTRKYKEEPPEPARAASPPVSYADKIEDDTKVDSAALILHDVGTKQERKDIVEDFKDGEVDFLFVYNMLLTGFDAKRLKKLYMGREIKSHNLLQALTRVNRTYKDFRYGYVVDFAGIDEEFKKTNEAYFEELQSELGDEIEHYSNLFKTPEEIKEEIEEIKEVLFHYNTENAEKFSQQISQIDDRDEMLKITNALDNAKSLYNQIRLKGHYELLEKLDFHKLKDLATEANNRLALINSKESLENSVDNQNLLNVALEDIAFDFNKVKEEELVIADELKETLQKTRESLGSNFDQKDPEFISLKEELERLFKKKKLTDVTKKEMKKNIKHLEDIYSRSQELKRKNELLKEKYKNDEKYARLHKRLMEKDPLTESERKLFEVLQDLKSEVDDKILQNSKMLENESYIKQMMGRIVINQFRDKHDIPIDAKTSKRINRMIVKEYMNEYYGKVA